MRAYTCLVILAVVSSPAHIFANEASSELDNLSEAAAPQPLCRETVCPRLYMPVCAIVDGEHVTVPSRCVLNNKIRCSSALQRSLGQTLYGGFRIVCRTLEPGVAYGYREDHELTRRFIVGSVISCNTHSEVPFLFPLPEVPRVRFLHSGPCSSKADKSIVGRKSRDMPIESEEEIVEEVPSEEEEGAHAEDNGENEEEEGAHEEDNGEEEVGAIAEEHDASNDKSDEHAEIHNSGESGESGEINAIQHHNIDDLEHLEDQADLDDKQAEADDAEAERDHAEELAEDEE